MKSIVVLGRYNAHNYAFSVGILIIMQKYRLIVSHYNKQGNERLPFTSIINHLPP